MTKTVEGVDRVTRMFEAFPAEMQKETKRLMRAAVKPWLAKMRSATPFAEWKRLSNINVKSKKGNTSLLVGFFGPKDVHFDWMKGYWYNYGTLTRRDPNHRFDNPVKRSVKNRRNELGQPARHFFDDASEGAAEDIAEKVIRGLEDYIATI